MKTVSDIVESFGGTSAFARFFGHPVATIQTWKRRNYLPADRDFDLVNEAERRQILLTYEDLAKIRRVSSAA